MCVATKWVCGVLVAVMALLGPLATWSAMAQAQTQPGYTGAPTTNENEVTGGDETGAGFLNIVYVPGKAIVCGVGTIVSAGVMLITLGSGYREAVGVFKEGCHGTWVLTGDHVAGKIPPKEDVQ